MTMSNTAYQLQINQIARDVSQSLRDVYGLGSRDNKHAQAWEDYGYKDSLHFNDHFQMYRRFGIATAGIKLPPFYCWKTKPKIWLGDEENKGDGTSAFEQAIEDLFYRFKLWKKLKLVDEFQRVGEYGAFIVQIKGSNAQADWSKPLANITGNNIVKFIPVYQDQLKPTSFEKNTNSVRFGQPTLYQFQENNIADDKDISSRGRGVTVHYSRVIIFAEGADDDSIYGTPANESGFNDLVTMEKIIGAGGEGFWKNASMKTAFTQTQKDARVPSQDEVDAEDEAIQDFMRGLDKHLRLGNVDAKVLQASLANPKEPFMIALQSYSASVQIAAKLLVGAQEGRLAASEDGKFTLSNFQSRREGWCSEMICSVIDWLIEHRVIESQKYFIEWDDLLAPSDADKFALGEKLSVIIERMVRVYGESFIDPQEVALIMGFEPVNVDMDLPIDGAEDEPETPQDEQ